MMNIIFINEVILSYYIEKHLLPITISLKGAVSEYRGLQDINRFHSL